MSNEITKKKPLNNKKKQTSKQGNKSEDKQCRQIQAKEKRNKRWEIEQHS